MVIDNTELIRSLLWFPPKSSDGFVMDRIEHEKAAYRTMTGNSLCLDSRECFYVVQLLQRMKDNPVKQFMNANLRNNSNRTIQQFQIYSLEDWDLKIPTIVDMAKYYQARVYIDLNLKDSKDVFAQLFRNMSERFSTCNYSKLHRIYNESVGQTRTMRNTQKRWLVDIDTHDANLISCVKSFILSLRGGSDTRFETDASGKRTYYADIVAEIPTKNGVHLITTTFQKDAFMKKFPELDVHTSNPTVAWMETDWSSAENRKENGNERD